MTSQLFRRSLDVLGLFAISLMVFGCGGGNPLGRLPVSGSVTLDGAPLDQGSIHFEPLGGGGAVGTGATIENGAYAIPGEAGLLPGKFKVVISSSTAVATTTTDPNAAMEEASKPPAADRIPAKYNVETELEADVEQGGPNKFDFDLKSK